MKSKYLIIVTILLILATGKVYCQQKEKNQNCIKTFAELDEFPIYMDTISFTEHIVRTWKYPYTDGADIDIYGAYLLSITIDTSGYISNIKILRDLGCEKCLANVYEILNTSKPFIPAKKNGKPVCFSISFLLPYDNRIRTFQSPFSLHQ